MICYNTTPSASTHDPVAPIAALFDLVDVIVTYSRPNLRLRRRSNTTMRQQWKDSAREWRIIKTKLRLQGRAKGKRYLECRTGFVTIPNLEHQRVRGRFLPDFNSYRIQQSRWRL